MNDVLSLICKHISLGAQLLDDGALEAWVELFDDTSSYRIVTRENVASGMPLALLRLDGKDMIRDRITSLRCANVFRIHTERRLFSILDVHRAADERYIAHTSFAIYHTDQEGRSFLFGVGRYNDCIAVRHGAIRFTDREVLLDTALVRGMLSVPL